ncbi:MAG: hypothetical protein JXM70_02905, partial [Pirellulales bacterium]|nr:hypothetical protein [Pirellulales bacterium]
ATAIWATCYRKSNCLPYQIAYHILEFLAQSYLTSASIDQRQEYAVMSLLADIDEWLAHYEHCSSRDIDTRRTVVVAFLEGLVRRLANEVCGLQLANDSVSIDKYVQRLWVAIRCHLPQCSDLNIHLEEEVQLIERGRLAQRQVDANVLADVVLVQALEFGETEAAEMFEQTYSTYIRAVAAKIGGPTAVDAVDNLVADLILPRTNRPTRLATYHGKTPLKSWLRTVVVNRVMALKRDSHEITGDTLPEAVSAGDLASIVLDRQCEEMLQPAFRSAVESVTTEDRVLLKMLVLDGVPQKQMANSMGIDPGTITRRKQKAAAGILSQIREFGVRSERPQAIRDCLERIIARESRELQMRLANVLAEEIGKDGPNDCEEAD